MYYVHCTLYSTYIVKHIKISTNNNKILKKMEIKVYFLNYWRRKMVLPKKCGSAKIICYQ